MSGLHFASPRYVHIGTDLRSDQNHRSKCSGQPCAQRADILLFGSFYCPINSHPCTLIEQMPFFTLELKQKNA